MERKIDFNVIINSFIILLPINIFIMFMITLYRFVFFLYFADFTEIAPLKLYVLKAFWMGFRFDLSVLAYINLPVTLILIACLFLKKNRFFKWSVSFFRYYYGIIFSLLFFVIFFDFGFFSYFKDHYNFLIFGFFEDDTFALIKTILADYRVYIALALFGLVCTAVYKFTFWTYQSLKLKERIINSVYWKKSAKICALIFIIAANFMAARGSLSMFPLGLFYAQISPNYFINKLCVNPVHPLADTVYFKIKNSKNQMNLKEFFGYKDDTSLLNDLKILPSNESVSALEQLYVKKTRSDNKFLETSKPNVILIVMEGFGEMPVLNNSPRFDVMGELKRHFEQDSVFYNFLPAGFITIHGIESIVLNIPQRPLSNQITQTPDSFKCFASSAALPYKNAGYDTIALYGGSMTWRDLESFFKVQGFEEVIGEGNIDAKPQDRHEWGINDDKFFELIRRYLSDKTDGRPKFIFAMSTGTHPPYKKPEKYIPLTLEIPENIKKMMSSKDLNDRGIFELYQFANRELAKFISYVKNSEFAQNTIIAVTGDHNLRELSNYSNEDMFLRYAVPFYLYIPKQLKPKNINTDISASHMDIMPTLYNLSLYNCQYQALGNDLLNVGANISFNIDGLAIEGTDAVKYNISDGTIESFTFDSVTKKLTPAPETAKHKALGRYYKAFMSLGDIFVKSQK